MAHLGYAWVASPPLMNARKRPALQSHGVIIVGLLLRRFRWVALLILTALSGCVSLEKYSFETFGQPTQRPETYANVTRSDLLALIYADYVAKLLEGRSTGARVTREISDSSLVVGGALAGAQETLGIAAETIAGMGVGVLIIRELQGIFNARGRSEAFADAAYLVRQAQAEFRAFNPNPSSDDLTENGATLVRRVDSALYAARKTLNGRMPALLDLQQATQPMSVKGATKISAGPTNYLATATGAVPLPPITQQQPYNPSDPVGNTRETPADIRADQITVATWITERSTAKEHAKLRQFIRNAGETPVNDDAKVSGQARRMARDATTRNEINKLLTLKELPLEPATNPTTTPSDPNARTGDATDSTKPPLPPVTPQQP